jgi:hypothetical protein
MLLADILQIWGPFMLAVVADCVPYTCNTAGMVGMVVKASANYANITRHVAECCNARASCVVFP